MLEQNNDSAEQNRVSDEASSSATKTRRSFLKKATVGAAIASIPAHSVWAGRLISGNMSGNVSGWADECQLYTRSQGYYSQHPADLPNSNETYKYIFGGEIVYGASQVVIFTKNGQPFDLTLAQVISGDNGVAFVQFIADSDTTIADVYASTTSGAVTSDVKNTHIGTGQDKIHGKSYTYILHVKGPSNVNLHMIAMYANAVNSLTNTANVYYPVLSPQGTLFADHFAYADYLYNLALINPSDTGVGLDTIIKTYDNGGTLNCT